MLIKLKVKTGLSIIDLIWLKFGRLGQISDAIVVSDDLLRIRMSSAIGLSGLRLN